ncbi:MAG: type III pantothenate kinase [Clostridia bacterium]|nr:type III pantothenate kinase [Clostridia bacterium]
MSNNEKYILLMDIGNTNIKIGIACCNKIVYTWRTSTDYNKTADEYGMILYDLLQLHNLDFDDINDIIVSSVAPSINYTIEHMCSYYMKKKPIFVSPNINLGDLKIKYNKNDIGADRIINAVAGIEYYSSPLIIVDFGTATTFGAINKDKEFIGGLIAPGIKSSTESLVNNAAKLPKIELVNPESILGTDTVSNMQSGVINGFTGLVEYIVNKIKKIEGFENAKVIATGGMSELITKNSNIIDIVDRALSLKGLNLVYNFNKNV